MPQNQVDLAGVFGMVAQTLAENQQALNQADNLNQDHGSNMVQTFQTITQALTEKQGSTDSAALKYAARQLQSKTTSGSGKMYAENLSQAASQFKGKSVDMQGAMQLLQILIGGGQAGGSAPQQAPQPAPQTAADLLGGLLGGMAGGGTATPQGGQAGGDLLSTLMGGLAGGGGSQAGAGGQQGFGLDDLLSAGMAYMQAKQSGSSGVEALVQAFMAGSGMGGAAYRTQSTQIVVNSFLKALGMGG